MTPSTIAYQASLSMGFSRQEYWSGLLFPSPGDLPDPGIEPRSPALRADALPSEPPGKPILCIREAHTMYKVDTNKNLLYSAGNSTECSVMTYMGGQSKREGYMCIYMNG